MPKLKSISPELLAGLEGGHPFVGAIVGVALNHDKFLSTSRASAVRELLRRGLAAEGFDLAGEGVRSSQFGIVDNGGADASFDEDPPSS